ncbi:MAG: hypothetical protein ACQETH_14005 [Candidatus Rifleibacteriota bacterium]
MPPIYKYSGFYLFFLAFLSVCSLAFALDEEDLFAEGEKLSYEGQLKNAEELMDDSQSSGKESESNDSSSMNTLLLSMIWGSIGVGFFIYGKKQSRAVFLLCGILLCVVPYFISSALASLIIGIVLFILPFQIKF